MLPSEAKTVSTITIGGKSSSVAVKRVLKNIQMCLYYYLLAIQVWISSVGWDILKDTVDAAEKYSITGVSEPCEGKHQKNCLQSPSENLQGKGRSIK